MKELVNRYQQNESPLFTAIQTLNEKERIAIFLRYWGPCSILEISRSLHLSWDKADELVNESLKKLRIEFRRRGFHHFGQLPFFQDKERK